MSAPVKLPAVFAKAETLSDNSIKLIFATRELGGADMAQLFGLKGTECWLLIAPNDTIEATDVPDYKPDTEVEKKTPGQRLRAVLYLHWVNLGKPGTFDDFYKRRMEGFINQYKEKLS